MTTVLAVEGMSCGHCERTVEEALRDVDGVTGATADREADRVTVVGSADVTALVQAVEGAGYSAHA